MIYKKLSILAAACAAAFAISSCDTPAKTNPAADTTTNNPSTSTRIAYINLDSLDAKYQYILDGKAKFEAEQKNAEGELKRLQQNIQNQYASLEKRIKDKSISEVEYQEVGKRIQGMEQSYQQKAQALSDQLMDKTDSFQKEYRRKVDEFLIAYNADGRYDYILSYQYSANLVLFANKTLDITKDVVEGLNKKYLADKSTSSASETKVK